MILNDKQIRAHSLVPTHQIVSHGHFIERHLYALVGDDLFSVDTGHRHSPDDFKNRGLEKLTPEQQRGYAPGGGIVPGTQYELSAIQVGEWDATDIERLKLYEDDDFKAPEQRAYFRKIREQLEALVVEGTRGEWGRMIYPFEPGQVRTRYRTEPLGNSTARMVEEKIISYGTSSMGYDVRLGRKFKVFTNVYGAVIDPLNMPDESYVDMEGDFVIIPPNSYVLGHTIEYFRMPEDVVAICVGKSTYARAGCAINVTPIEPGFEGQVVIEIANQTPLPMKVYADMGIAQFMFFKGDPCEVSYAKRAGKYQGQLGITTARV